MKCLLTGCVGFIGLNLLNRLLIDNHIVYGFDRNVDRADLLYDVAGENKDFHMIWGALQNVHNHNDIDIERIYHLAASTTMSGVNEYTDIHDNTNGTHEVLEFMRRNDVRELMFTSSSAVYGIAEYYPTCEYDSDMHPIGLYGASKLAAEAFIRAYADLYGFKIWIFRPANVVGQYQRRGIVHDIYYKLKKDSKNLDVLGDGKQIKSYIDVNDCINAFRHITGKYPEGIYNLANVDALKVYEIVSIICDELGVSPSISFTGEDRGWKGDVPITIMDIERILNTGWYPEIEGKDAIRQAVKYFVSVDGEING
jgi:UDP-glucose 4-epimerase